MFRVNLTDLDREGSKEIRGELSPEDPLWNDLEEERPTRALRVDLTLTTTSSGQVIARGSMQTELERNCRRCLEPVTVEIDEELSLVWSIPDELGEEDDGEIRLLEPTSNELELGEALREEFLLAVPRFALCSETCAGLCPRCGVNRNETTCDCTLEERDPRWDALRELQTE
jgi:uncharacterized protein